MRRTRNRMSSTSCSTRAARSFIASRKRLIREVCIPRPDEDQASDLPGPEVFGDRAFSQCCLPCSLECRRIVAEPTPPARVRKLDAPEALQRLDEGLHTLAPRGDESLGDHTPDR